MYKDYFKGSDAKTYFELILAFWYFSLLSVIYSTIFDLRALFSDSEMIPTSVLMTLFYLILISYHIYSVILLHKRSPKAVFITKIVLIMFFISMINQFFEIILAQEYSYFFNTFGFLLVYIFIFIYFTKSKYILSDKKKRLFIHYLLPTLALIAYFIVALFTYVGYYLIANGLAPSLS